MARFSKARWRGPIPNQDAGQLIHPLLGLVLHVEQGSESGTNSWFHNPGAEASAHFGNPFSGPLDQWVDTASKAWAEVAGNSRWISVEHEGYSTKAPAPTANQIENDAQLLAWLHKTEDIPLQSSDSVYHPGLGWHGMGGQAWGGHYDCPGGRIKDARPKIIKRAKIICGEHHPVLKPALKEGSKGVRVEALQRALNKHIKNLKLRVDGDFGPSTRRAVNEYKRLHKWTQNGIAGRRMLKSLGL